MSPIDAVLSGAQQWCVIHADNAEVLPALADKSVDHVITDPPYTQQTSDNARSSKDRGAHAYIDFAGTDGGETLIAREWPRLASRWVVVFCALEQLAGYQAGSGKEWIRGTVWHRTNSAPQFTGDRPGQAVEGVAIMHRRGRKRWNRGGDCLFFSGPTANSTGERDKGHGHPTPKPVWLMQECLEAFTDPGEVVLDPFCGSGTTGVACLRLGRRFIGIERDAKYAALAQERLEAESKGLTLRDARAGQLSLLGDS